MLAPDAKGAVRRGRNRRSDRRLRCLGSETAPTASTACGARGFRRPPVVAAWVQLFVLIVFVLIATFFPA